MMDSAWSAWIDASLAELEKEHRVRVLRPLVPFGESAATTAIHRDQLAAWLAGAPAVDDPRALYRAPSSSSSSCCGSDNNDGRHHQQQRQQQWHEQWQQQREHAAKGNAEQPQTPPQEQDQEQEPPLPPNHARLRMFGTNDYLGLSAHAEVRAAAARAALRGGMGPRASALVAGFTAEHRALERELAALKGAPDALLFPTGFAANMAVLSVLASGLAAGQQQQQQQQQAVANSGANASAAAASAPAPAVIIYSDELNHASIVDGARLAVRSSAGGGGGNGGGSGNGHGGAQLRVYRHGDLAHLEALLRAAPAGARKLVVTDGLFSMDGDFADLRGLARLRRRYGFLLVVDDAHATLVCGAHGGGTAEMQRCARGSVDVTVGTLSKAAGCVGGFVACGARVRELLLNRGRGVVFSTALPLPVVAAARAALAAAAREGWRRRHVWALTARLSQAVGVPAHSPIIPIVLGSEAVTMEAARRLLSAGFHVGAIRPPTVPAGTCRLRVSLSAAHSAASVDALAAALRAVMEAAGVRAPAAALEHLAAAAPWGRAWLEEQDARDAAAEREAAAAGGSSRGSVIGYSKL